MRNLKTVNYDEMFTLSAPSPKWVWNAQGQLVEVPAGQPAWDHDPVTGEPLGQRIESAEATNLLLNSFAPATQTVSVSDATTYTLSVYGSGSAEITAGGSGTATDGSPLTFTTTGTSVTVTVTGTLDVFQLEAGSDATSPIETTGSAVIRAADAAACESAFAEQYDPAQGWLFIDYDAAGGDWIFQTETEGATNNYRSFLIRFSELILFDAPSITFNYKANLTGHHKALLKWENGIASIYLDGELLFSGEYEMPPWVRAVFYQRTARSGSAGSGHLFDFRMGDTISDADAIARTTL